MKVVQINPTYKTGGSTGKICYAISKVLDEEGIWNKTIVSQGRTYDANVINVGNKLYYKVQAFKSRVLGNNGFNSHIATLEIIRELKRIKPDVVHLHILHSHNVNIKMLFDYFKRNPQIKIFWTFHDCWEFTGYCDYFDIDKCYKWQSGCYDCPQRKTFSWFLDRSKDAFNKKLKATRGQNLTIITPSKWLGGLVKQSFLKDYPVKVINNGINLKVFKPTSGDFRQRYNVGDKFIVLGVAAGWGKRKGLDVLVELSKRLDSREYQIVLVGTNDAVDESLPSNIISIHRTTDQAELARIYSASDLFVNPTREENYPTVNMEAIACGTPVLTFRTGGSPEIVDEKSGSVVDTDDVAAMEREIIRIKETRPFSREDCVERAKSFDENDKFREYVELYSK